MRKTFLAILLALALVLIPAGNAFAETTQDVDVTATPSIMSISNAPAAWPINGAAGKILHNATYYSNEGADETLDPGTVEDSECRFTVTNDGDLAVDINISFSDFSGSLVDVMVNSDDGTADVGEFGAFAYLSLGSTPGTILTVVGTDDVMTALAALDTKKWGLTVLTRTDPFTDILRPTLSATVTLTASPS